MLQSYFYKYTLIGSCLNIDKKYLLREMLLIACSSIACLNINQVIYWPCGIELIVLLMMSLLYEGIIKKYGESQIDDYQRNKQNNQVES